MALVLAKNLSTCFSWVWSSRIYFPASLRSQWVWFPPVNTTMKALTPQPNASLVCGTAEVSLLISIELPNIPSPTTLLPFRSPQFDTLPGSVTVRAVSPTVRFGRTDLSRSSLGRCVRSGVRELLGRSPTGLAESSLLSLRTVHSPLVALHPFC
jgi:hypothetical protein